MVDTTLGGLIEERIRERGISIREAGRQIGVAHTTVQRIIDGKPVDIDTLIQCTEWLEVDPATALNSLRTDDLASQLALVIQREPELGKVFKQAMGRFERGEISSSDIREIIAYAAFRLGQ